MQARPACDQASVRMQDVGGIQPGLQRFCYGGKNLEDPQRTLEQCMGNCWTCPRTSCMTHESDMIYRLNMMQNFMAQCDAGMVSPTGSPNSPNGP
jgi:hypothetical protein